MNRLYSYEFAGDGTGTYTRNQDYYSYTSATGSSWEWAAPTAAVQKMLRGSRSTVRPSTCAVKKNRRTTIRPTRSMVGLREFNALIPESTLAKFLVLATASNSTVSDLSPWIVVFDMVGCHPLPVSLERVGPTKPPPHPVRRRGTAKSSKPATMFFLPTLRPIGRRLPSATADYWISADNGTHWEEVESEATIHFDHPETNSFGKPTHWLHGGLMVGGY